MISPISSEVPGANVGAPADALLAPAGACLVGGGKPALVSPTDPEVPEKKPNRKSTAKYKLRILAEADAFTEQWQLGALLRRAGLYSSNLATWRRRRENGLLKALAPKKRSQEKREESPENIKKDFGSKPIHP